jgi:hypothetical protein
MFGFKVTWSSFQQGADMLKLAFDTQAQAEEWHAAFADAIQRQAARRPKCVAVFGGSRVGALMVLSPI